MEAVGVTNTGKERSAEHGSFDGQDEPHLEDSHDNSRTDRISGIERRGNHNQDSFSASDNSLGDNIELGTRKLPASNHSKSDSSGSSSSSTSQPKSCISLKDGSKNELSKDTPEIEYREPRLPNMFVSQPPKLYRGLEHSTSSTSSSDFFTPKTPRTKKDHGHSEESDSMEISTSSGSHSSKHDKDSLTISTQSSNSSSSSESSEEKPKTEGRVVGEEAGVQEGSGPAGDESTNDASPPNTDPEERKARPEIKMDNAEMSSEKSISIGGIVESSSGKQSRGSDRSSTSESSESSSSESDDISIPAASNPSEPSA
eukprot:gnl/Chilomastix_caulleri/473.p1 GENE.gnl/Chilomastix_caulleri/473~~gnl/Chilomastix_caulleri/473.p1  ORF type:complete len:314 (-),score=101.54 gnl/Chilomastix_caulleri/473:29-970(-)